MTGRYPDDGVWSPSLRIIESISTHHLLEFFSEGHTIIRVRLIVILVILRSAISCVVRGMAQL